MPELRAGGRTVERANLDQGNPDLAERRRRALAYLQGEMQLDEVFFGREQAIQMELILATH